MYISVSITRGFSVKPGGRVWPNLGKACFGLSSHQIEIAAIYMCIFNFINCNRWCCFPLLRILVLLHMIGDAVDSINSLPSSHDFSDILLNYFHSNSANGYMLLCIVYVLWRKKESNGKEKGFEAWIDVWIYLFRNYILMMF